MTTENDDSGEYPRDSGRSGYQRPTDTELLGAWLRGARDQHKANLEQANWPVTVRVWLWLAALLVLAGCVVAIVQSV